FGSLPTIRAGTPRTFEATAAAEAANADRAAGGRGVVAGPGLETVTKSRRWALSAAAATRRSTAVSCAPGAVSPGSQMLETASALNPESDNSARKPVVSPDRAASS